MGGKTVGGDLAPVAVIAREAPAGIALRADETPGAHEANRGSVWGADVSLKTVFTYTLTLMLKLYVR